MKVIHSAFLLFFLAVLGCSPDHRQPNPPDISSSFSFEGDMEEWAANGTDLALGNTTIDWSIGRTQERASSGTTAIKLYLANLNDAGKIWIERPFSVEPDSLYQVQVQYEFGTGDWGDVNLFSIITGVVPRRPQTRDELVYQGSTGNGSNQDVGYVWLPKSYDFTASSGPEGRLYVIIGVWGTAETERTYFLDNIRVTFTRQ